ASAGNYTVTVKDGYNCSTNNFKTISQPQPISISIDTETINGNTKNATINVSGGTAPYTYIINNSLELISSIITNIKSGFYNVLIKDKNNCIQNATFSVEAATPTNETESQFEILNVYPNPATDIMNLNFSLKEYKDVKVELYDLSGQTIYYNEYNNVKEQQASVDLSMLSTGTYLLKFGLPEGNTFRKIIVSR
ncbi:MAG TPA: T9SS type A sorting domain-containing protein, partial [Chitinophagales bacterium]|nr:T9SS type A sorting domain-containing protein [Chitinophagales bacterium]